jgi:hypothetical protein
MADHLVLVDEPVDHQTVYVVLPIDEEEYKNHGLQREPNAQSRGQNSDNLWPTIVSFPKLPLSRTVTIIDADWVEYCRANQKQLADTQACEALLGLPQWKC